MRPLAIVDTNVLVSGLLTGDPQAPTARIVDAMLDGSLRFVLSVALLAEYQEVLERRRIAIRHGLSPEEVQAILVALTTSAVIREPASLAGPTFPAGDHHLEELLADSPAALLVPGDSAVAHRAGARAVSPRTLAERLRRGDAAHPPPRR